MQITVVSPKADLKIRQITLRTGRVVKDAYGIYIKTEGGTVNLENGNFYSDERYHDSLYELLPQGTVLKVTI